jgi:protein-tyrosine phosphatase
MLAAMDKMNRNIPLQGAFNFRDLGGYRTRDGHAVKWRRLFRSDALHFLTLEDALVLRDTLGVRTVIDLRSPAQVENDGLGLFVRPPVDHVPAPVIDDATLDSWRVTQVTSVESYVWMFENSAELIARALKVLADRQGDPAVFHCFAGKDRTGVLAAAVLGTLGVDDETIADDYSLTAPAMKSIVDRMVAAVDGPSRANVRPETYEARRETMLETLGHVNSRWGSVEGFARAAGVGPDTVARLREALLE